MSGPPGSFSQTSKPNTSRANLAYRVDVTARAARDLARIYRRIDAEHSDAALIWYRGFKQAIFALEEHPNRCSVTPENHTLRHLLYGNKPHVYRVIYRILEKQRQVQVLHIRHGARREFSGSDVA